MNVFDVCKKHCEFRNLVAHSPLWVEGSEDNQQVRGIFALTPKCSKNIAQIISIEELKGRVTESARLVSDLIALRKKFTV
jgi:hypothetical protein